jgi:DNA-binding response OmpR family regulator
VRAGTILIVEENAAVAELVEQALRESPHRVLSTQSALEALEVIRRVQIDVLVAGRLLDDHRAALVDELCARQPDLVVASICEADDDLAEIELGARLTAPFSLAELEAVVEASLERRREAP